MATKDRSDYLSIFAGVKDVSSIDPDMTLADLGLDSLMGVEVKQTLERDYDLVLAMREIRQLTVNKLREVAGGGGAAASTGGGDSSALNDSGVSVRYSIAEIMPSQCIVEMKAGEKSKAPLFLVHPIEGRHVLFYFIL